MCDVERARIYSSKILSLLKTQNKCLQVIPWQIQLLDQMFRISSFLNFSPPHGGLGLDLDKYGKVLDETVTWDY